MAKEIVTTKLGETVTVFTGGDAIEHILKIARECAAEGGTVAAEVVTELEAELEGLCG